MRAMLIYNPNAGKHLADGGFQPVVSTLNAHGWEIDLRPTRGQGDATRLAASAVEASMDAVLVAGGDGTLNEAIQALAGRETAMGYLPYGTVNNWARELAIPLDPVGAAMAFVGGETRSVDLGLANGRYFLLMAGLGLDGAVLKRARAMERYKQRFGILPYVAVGLSTVPRYRGEDVELRYDGVIRRIQAVMLVVGNTRLYGGHWRFTPAAVATDGWLDLCIVKGRGALSLVKHSASLLISGTVGRSDIEMLRVRDLTVAGDVATPFQLDGELAGQLPLSLSVASGALRVIIPRDRPVGLIA